MTVADIQTLLEQRTEAWARRDPAALAAGYADDAVVSSPMFPRAEGRPGDRDVVRFAVPRLSRLGDIVRRALHLR